MPDRNILTLRQADLPANELGYLIKPDPEFDRHVLRVGEPFAVFGGKATRRIEELIFVRFDYRPALHPTTPSCGVVVVAV